MACRQPIFMPCSGTLIEARHGQNGHALHAMWSGTACTCLAACNAYDSMACDGPLFCSVLQGCSIPGHAARALWNLTSKNPANQEATREAGAVPRLVAMLRDEPTKVRRNRLERQTSSNHPNFCCFALLATVLRAACSCHLGEVVVTL